MKNRKRKYAFFILLVFFGSAALGIIAEARMRKPNIIFVTFDSLRADHLGCYGYKRATSGHIDLLSRQGATFTQAIAQSSWTPLSVSSIITSLYPNCAGLTKGYALSPVDDNLIRQLHDNGYTTALFSNAKPILDITFEYIKGAFDDFVINYVKADVVVASAIQWLSRNPKKPFFLWVYIYEPHSPYNADPSYYSDFLKDGLYPHRDVSFASYSRDLYFSLGAISRAVAEADIHDTSYYIAKYDGGIKFADEQAGKLFLALRQKGLANNTAIVFFSDHGESMDEHGFYFNHGSFLYEYLLRVPLVIVLPGVIPQSVIPEQVQMINLLPTVLELAHIKIGSRFEGKSLLSLMRGKKRCGDRYAFSETSSHFFPQSIRSDKWKLVYNRYDKNSPYELFSLKDDPAELRNVIADNPDVAASFKTTFTQWLKSAKTTRLKPIGEFSDEETRKLRSLGYL